MKTTTKERLIELLDVFPEEGRMVWKRRVGPARVVTSWNSQFAGREAGALHQNGFVTISVDGLVFKLHRLMWLFVHGVMPDGIIDHINGNPADNRISNLRVATLSENSRNAKRSAANRSGCTGVFWASDREKWTARIVANGRQVSLGDFLEKADAIAARKAAERQHGYHPNHGRAA